MYIYLYIHVYNIYLYILLYCTYIISWCKSGSSFSSAQALEIVRCKVRLERLYHNTVEFNASHWWNFLICAQCLAWLIFCNLTFDFWIRIIKAYQMKASKLRNHESLMYCINVWNSVIEVEGMSLQNCWVYERHIFFFRISRSSKMSLKVVLWG